MTPNWDAPYGSAAYHGRDEFQEPVNREIHTPEEVAAWEEAKRTLPPGPARLAAWEAFENGSKERHQSRVAQARADWEESEARKARAQRNALQEENTRLRKQLQAQDRITRGRRTRADNRGRHDQ
jgi:hypothetical protein